MKPTSVKLVRIPFLKTICCFIPILILLPICFSSALSQQTDPKEKHIIDSLLSQGNTFFSYGKTEESEKCFKEILEIDKNSVTALTGLGKIYFANNELSGAREFFEKALLIDTSNKLSHYYCSIVNRDFGRFRRIIEEIFLHRSYKKSYEHFNWIFQRDSLFLDAFYQYSLLLKYQDKYVESLDAIITQIRLKPELPEPYCGLMRTFHAGYDKEIKKDFENFLSFSRNPLKRFLSAELFRMQGDFEESESILHELFNSKIIFPKTLIYISLFKIYAQKNESEPLESLYWRAVGEIKNSADANLLFNDLKYTASLEEIDLFYSITAKDKIERFFKSFWNKRNPASNSKSNPRLVEHYKRLAYAEKNFIFDHEGFTFFKGSSKQYLNWKTPDVKKNINNLPDLESEKGSYSLNYEFTDQGLIYIRHGEPDETARTAGDVESNESWLYYETPLHQRMIFNFSGLRKYLIPAFLDPALLKDRVFWNPNYYQMINKKGSEQIILQDKLINDGIKNIDFGLKTENSLWTREIKNFDLPFTINTFKGNNYKTLVELTYLIPVSSIFVELSDTIKSLNIETGFTFFNKNWDKIVNKVDTINVERPQKQSFATTRFFCFNLNPDSCHSALFFHPIGTEIYGNAKTKIGLPDYYRKGLRISDIEVAEKIEKASGNSPFNKNGLIVIPYPIQKYPINKPLNLYFEIYNLSKNLEGKTIFQIEYTGKYSGSDKNLISGIFSKDKTYSISTEYNRFGTEEKSIEYISIDVSKLEPGLYQFEIKIRDINAQKTASNSCLIDLQNLDSVK